MSLKNQLNFASGELNPSLHDRVTLQRFQNGLDTARNVAISKTGSNLSRFSTKFIAGSYFNGPIKLFSVDVPTFSREVLYEFGIDTDDSDKFYIAKHTSINTTDYASSLSYKETTGGSNSITRFNITDLEFILDGSFIYILNRNGDVHRFSMSNDEFYTDHVFATPKRITATLSGTAFGTPSGYAVDYAATYVYQGEESDIAFFLSSGLNKPIAAGQRNELIISLPADVRDKLPINEALLLENVNEVRIYRRPQEGSAYGLVGVTTEIYDDAGVTKAKFTDIGADADFTNGPPSNVLRESFSNVTQVTSLEPKTGVIYQGRLLLGNLRNASNDFSQSVIAASRPGYVENFERDFPYDSDSALLFKTSGGEQPSVERMIDSDGLVVFTNKGVFSNLGLLSPTNALIKRGPWVIDERVPPLQIPGALLFIDKSTNSVKQLVYSQELTGYNAVDLSVYSDHFFEEERVVGWSFQGGVLPLLIVVFSNGSFATFTYEVDQRMRAWTRHDSKYPAEQFEKSSVNDTSYVVFNKDGNREIHITVPRIPTVEIRNTFVLGPQSKELFKLSEYYTLMDGLTISFTQVYDGSPLDVLSLTPVTVGVWGGQLTLNSTRSAFTSTFGNAGEVYRWFNPEDGAFIDLTFISKTDNDNVVVEPSEEFPSEYASDVKVFLVTNTITGLSHLDGETVSVVVDGGVVSSPNNDHVNDNFIPLTVSSGEVTIPDEYAGAFTVVGRPITSDIATLNVSTVEQSPTMIESLTVNKLYVRVKDTRGLFVDNQFPENKTGGKDGSSVDEMQTLDYYVKKSGELIIGNRAKPDYSGRIEVTTPGNWENRGKICMRQVDPLHFEIISIILDIEVERRR